MTIYCGVDFHTRQQLIKWCDTRDGENLHHQLLLPVGASGHHAEALDAR